MEFSTLQDVIVAVGEMRTANLQPHPDGFFHCTLSYDTISTLFGDPVFQRLNQSMPLGIPNKQRFLGLAVGNRLLPRRQNRSHRCRRRSPHHHHLNLRKPHEAYGTPGGEYASLPRAAVVTQVSDKDDHLVGLAILNPTGMFFTPEVHYSAEPKPGHWSWPPRG